MVFSPEEWAPPRDWGEVKLMPEAVIEALHKVGRPLEKQRACKAVGSVDWLFLTVLKKAMWEKDELL